MKVAWLYPIHVTPLPKHQKTLSYNERPLFYSKNKKTSAGGRTCQGQARRGI